MVEWSLLWVFVIAALVLAATPGPAVLYIVARSIDQGRLAGIVSSLGIAAGALFHIAAAALGVSALLLSSALAFSILKYAGAAYLIYLGVRTLLTRPAVDQPVVIERKPLARIFSDGVVVNVLNPKTALFFFAFLPQFVDPARGPVSGQIVLLGLLFILVAMTSDSIYALLAGTLGGWLKRGRALAYGQRYFAGSVYVALGVTLALAGHKSQ